MAARFGWLAPAVVAVSTLPIAIADDGPKPAPAAPAQAQVQGKAATPTPAALTNRPAEEQAARELLKSFMTAYNAARAEDMAVLFSAEGALIDGEGAVLRGREAILGHYQDAFSAGACAQLEGTITAMRFLTPDVAQVEGEFSLFEGKPGEGPVAQTGRFSSLAVRKDGQWRIAELRDDPDPLPEPESNYERLQELEWLVGDWVDESGNVRNSTTVRWAENRNFLVRTYTVQLGGEPVSSGTQWIGWDPRAGQVRSWSFDSQGGLGEGLWARVDQQWIIKATGTLRDGRATSSTQVVTILNNDAVRLSAFDRFLGDELQPDVAELVMVRKPPAPTVTTSEARP